MARVTPESRPPLSPPPSSPDIAGVRVPAIRLSDRLLQRLRRVVATRPYFCGAIVFHALLALLLLNVAAFDARKSAQVAAAEAAKTAQRIAQTQARDLQHRVERMQAILEELAPNAKPSAAAASATRRPRRSPSARRSWPTPSTPPIARCAPPTSRA